jgi:glycosyltransferase involved in cell wall biosynthesis
MQKPLKIGIGVHGRFHAFGLASGLLALGHDVHVFTNYPASVAARFGLPVERVRGFPLHGLAVRLLARLGLTQRFPMLDAWMHTWFARWLSRRLTAESWDATYTWSSVSLEYLKAKRTSTVRLIARGSTHIREQWKLLHDEEARSGCFVDKPTEEIMQREQSEYELADGVIVLSSFSRETFLQAGVPADKVHLMVSAVNVSEFTATEAAREARIERLYSNQPVRVLSVGTFSFRKGALDFAEMVQRLSLEGFVFRFVGTVAPEAEELARSLTGKMEFVPRVPQSELKAHYEWGDFFVLPSIEEGLAAVLPQAKAAGLLILSTPNSGAGDVVVPGVHGWILPARDATAFVDQLLCIKNDRQILGATLQQQAAEVLNRSWSDAAQDFTGICHKVCATRAASGL